MELAKVTNHRSGTVVRIDVDPYTGLLTINNGSPWTPEQFKELGHTMIRVADGVPGIVQSWREQQEAKKRRGFRD